MSTLPVSNLPIKNQPTKTQPRIDNYRFRAIWISDVHLGSKDCKAEYLHHFLTSTQCEFLYLVGDIVDLWSMRRTMFWPDSHNSVIRTVLDKAAQGTQVFYIPGNHDETFREYDGVSFGNLHIRTEHVHETADGRRLLVLHGDKFDADVKCGPIARYIGSQSYDFIMRISRWILHARNKLGFPYWSLAAYVKARIKNAQDHIRDFERAAAHEARSQNADGIVCGHIHQAEMYTRDGVEYMNDGDWVENCTALIEHRDGEIELLHWSDQQKTLKARVSALDERQPKVA